MNSRNAGILPANARPVAGWKPALQLLDELAEYTRSSTAEVCAFVYPDRYFPLRNTAISPDRFVADPADIARALFLYGEPQAVFHSHPDGKLSPSLLDQLGFYYSRSMMAIGGFRDGQFQINLVQFAVYGHGGD